MQIEFLYYDKTSCRRCIATEKSVKAMKEMKMPIKFIEKKLPKSKTNISPSVRINGKDVEKIVNRRSQLKENLCKDCCDTAGEVKCRTFAYKRKSYDYIPKGMIKDAIKIILKKG